MIVIIDLIFEICLHSYKIQDVDLLIYDVIVVGGGPSGALAAKTCAENGLSVLLLEKEKVPRYKACGGAVSKKALDLIGNYDELEPFFDLHGARTFTPDLEPLIHKFNDVVSILTFRDSFDKFLLKNAESNAMTILENERVLTVDQTKEFVEITTSNNKYQSRIIIGADGANGIVAKSTKIRKNWGKDASGICAELEIELNDNEIKEYVFDPQLIDFYFIKNWGYGWVFPKGNILSVGIGGMRNRVNDPMNSLSNFLNLLSEGKSTRLDEHIVSKKAHLIPAGGVDRVTYSNGVMLVGDAAGFVDPFLGEGIYYAIASGIIAGEVATEAIRNNDCSADFLKEYEKRCDKEFNNDLKFAFKFAKNAYDHLDFFMLCLKNDPVLYKNYLLTAKGDYTYKQYLNKCVKRFPITVGKIIYKKYMKNNT